MFRRAFKKIKSFFEKTIDVCCIPLYNSKSRQGNHLPERHENFIYYSVVAQLVVASDC